MRCHQHARALRTGLWGYLVGWGRDAHLCCCARRTGATRCYQRGELRGQAYLFKLRLTKRVKRVASSRAMRDAIGVMPGPAGKASTARSA